jgi:hypothetical protein
MGLCGVGAVWNRILCRLSRYNSKLWNFCFIHSLGILYSARYDTSKVLHMNQTSRVGLRASAIWLNIIYWTKCNLK